MSEPNLYSDIRAAFADVPYPGDDQLTVYDAAGRDYDETFQLLCGRTWQNFPVVEFMRGDTPIPDLSPEAFHYYMPALLIASLDETLDVDVSDSLAFYLSPLSVQKTGCEFPDDHAASYDHQMSLFNDDQRKVIIRVLEEYVKRGWESEAEVHRIVEVLRGNTDGE